LRSLFSGILACFLIFALLISSTSIGSYFRDRSQVAYGKDSGQCLDPRHVYLRNIVFSSPSINKALKNAHATRQVPDENSIAPIKYDEFKVTIREMPPNLTPEDFLNQMLMDIDDAVDDGNLLTPNDKIVKDNNDFTWVLGGASPNAGPFRVPTIGDIYTIEIAGPDNGGVMLVEKSPDHFVFQAIKLPFKEGGSLPESGVREFGFQRNRDGSVSFYTRGVSQAELGVGELYNTLLDSAFGQYFQGRGWEAMMHAISEKVQTLGGKSDPSSISIFKKELKPTDKPAKYLCGPPNQQTFTPQCFESKTTTSGKRGNNYFSCSDQSWQYHLVPQDCLVRVSNCPPMWQIHPPLIHCIVDHAPLPWTPEAKTPNPCIEFYKHHKQPGNFMYKK
jgi:hypothetical protein